MLLVLNGAPGVGKSALAERYARDHALALVVDIDELRRHLGQWQAVDASKRVARDLAVALVRDHLAREHDVVVPQYIARREFADWLREIADDAGTRFVEVVLTDLDDAVIERFRARRAALAARGTRHPEADLGDGEVDSTIRAANVGLRRAANGHEAARLDVGSGIDAAYAALIELLAEDP